MSSDFCCSFLLGTVGCGLSRVAACLADDSVEVEDIESEITRLGGKAARQVRDRAPCGKTSGSNSPVTMLDVTHYLSREEVRNCWREAACSALDRLTQSKRKHRILCGHALYYSRQRHEYYSPIDLTVLGPNRGHQVKYTRVVLLIDDVYDMFLRLSNQLDASTIDRAPQVLDAHVCASHVGWLWKKYQDSRREGSDRRDSDDATATTLWKFHALCKLVEWRKQEIVLAEHLAAALQAEFVVFAVKQLRKTLKLLLTSEEEGIAVYLSHPITEARRHEQRNGQRPPFVDEVNRVQGELADHSIALVMPTGIDEYRFSEGEGFLEYTPKLRPRWPTNENTEDLLVVPGDGMHASEAQVDDVFQPQLCFRDQGQFSKYEGQGREAVLSAVTHYLRLFVEKVSEDVAFRDHTLIAACGKILLFRPLFGGRYTFSSGVQREVRHWGTLPCGTKKRLAVVHFEDDIREAFFQNDRGANRLARDYNSALDHTSKLNLSNDQWHRLKQNGEISDEAILGASDPKRMSDAQRDFKGLIVDVMRKVLLDFLCGHELMDRLSDPQAEKSICVWVVGDYAQFTDSLAEIASFLQGHEPGEGSQLADKLVEDALKACHKCLGYFEPCIGSAER